MNVSATCVCFLEFAAISALRPDFVCNLILLGEIAI